MPLPRVFTWHVHGNYLYYLSQARAEFYVPLKQGRPSGYGGRGDTFPFGPNVHEVPVASVPELRFDCVLYQSHRHYLEDRFEILSEEQQRLPAIFLEHDPPRQSPTDTVHVVDDPNVLLVHVTHFNNLMWDSGRCPTRVIEHGVMVPEHTGYSGELPCGIVVVNHMKQRGRRLGLDIFLNARRRVCLDLVGMASEDVEGLGEVEPPALPEFEARYRFFFNPIRYTSLGLAVLEAMTLGMPIVGLATTEMAAVVENGVSGYVSTNLDECVYHMKELLRSPAEARRLGENGRKTAQIRFGIERFARDWEETFSQVIGPLRGVLSARAPLTVEV